MFYCHLKSIDFIHIEESGTGSTLNKWKPIENKKTNMRFIFKIIGKIDFKFTTKMK